jgi:3-oxoacyl-[acyl-carrier-protein] synthase-3
MTSLPTGVGFRFAGVGSHLPDTVITNDDLSENMDTSHEWILERTGIARRHVGGSTSELATIACQRAMDRAGVGPDDIDHLLLATTSPDFICPGTAPAVANNLGLDCGALDIQAACSGWVYGLVHGNGLMLQGMKRILVAGAEALDQITDYTDRGTGILFGNGAGAAVIEPDTTGRGALLGFDMGAAGEYVRILYAEHGGLLQMDGKEVFRQAVTAINRSATNALERAGLTIADVDLVIPHQANIRIVEAAWKKLGFSMEQTAMRLHETGNTSAASIPLVLDEALDQGRVSEGSIVMFVGFGAGMTWASTVHRWAGDVR